MARAGESARRRRGDETRRGDNGRADGNFCRAESALSGVRGLEGDLENSLDSDDEADGESSCTRHSQCHVINGDNV